jgi:FMN reductase (NADPH)
MLRAIKNLLALFTGKPPSASRTDLPETLKLIFNRRSCRSFAPGDIAAEDLEAILDAGRFTPSTVNLQTWSFITFDRAQWQQTFERPIPFKGAYAIVICADQNRLSELFADFAETPAINMSLAIFNAGLAAMNMNLAAEALGIKSIMLSETGRTGLLDTAFLVERLGLPDGVLPLTTLVLGRSSMSLPGIPPRQPREAVVMQQGYNAECKGMLRDWFDQMFIGFKIGHPLSNFDKQLAFYRKKMIEAEQVVRRYFGR